MYYPTITHISDVIEAVRDDSAFRITEKDCGHTYINYNHMGNDAFPPLPTDAEWAAAYGDAWEMHVLDQQTEFTLLRRECRGIAFNTITGLIASRPFHKFFNAGERDETSMANLPFDKPHVIMDKMDGSMIRPIFVEDGCRWGTKAGLTDVAKLAETFAARRDKYDAFAYLCRDMGITPIFEYVSRKNRIVVDYPVADMVLLAIRDNVTGYYWTVEERASLAREFDIPLVKVYQGDIGDNSGLENWDADSREGATEKFVQSIRQSSDIPEGVVVSWGNLMIKIKTDEYSELHRAKEKMATERNLITVILADKVDDLLPLLDEEQRVRLTAFVDSFWNEMNHLDDAIAFYYTQAKAEFDTKRGFAVSGRLADSQHIRSTVFALWDGKVETPRDAVMKILETGLSSETKWKETKAKWDLPFEWTETEDDE